MSDNFFVTSRTRVANFLLEKISFTTILLILFAIDFPYQYGLRYLSLQDSIAHSLIDALLCGAILWISTRLDLARVTILFLALPYLFFIPGWLNVPSAIIVLSIFIYCVFASIKQSISTHQDAILVNNFIAFLLILIVVNIFGAGGYGSQSGDYLINYARLNDLVIYEWPIRYEENKNFVYYFGYFLPSAVIGKIFSYDIAVQSLYPWTVLGITLVIRWLCYLTQWRFSIVAVLFFVFFGPLDILNVMYAIQADNGMPVTHLLYSVVSGSHDLMYYLLYSDIDFVTNSQLGVVIGNYLSNLFQLYWSPQQVIAGWLVMAFVFYLSEQQKLKSLLFVYALLCLWGPLVMIAIFPFVLLTLVRQCIDKQYVDVFSIQNTIGAGTLIIVFLTFYLGGSAAANPSYWIFNSVNWNEDWPAFLVYYLSGWGLYALVLFSFISNSNSQLKSWFICLLCVLAILPVRIFGEWSDLMCRGSAPLMMLMLIFILKGFSYYWTNQQKALSIVLLCLFILGTGSAMKSSYGFRLNYGDPVPVTSLLMHDNAYPNFGPDHTLFEQLFRKKLPQQ